MKLAPCPDCGNACSLTAVTCPRCGRIMKPGDLSESNVIKPTDYSKLLNVLAHALVAVCGVIGFFVVSILESFFRWRFVSLDFRLGFIFRLVILRLIFLIPFLLLGILFGFIWDKLGWKLGLSLSSLIIIIWCVAFLLDVFSASLSFGEVVQLYLPVLVDILSMLIGSCLGAYIGAEYKRKQHVNNGAV